LNTRTGAHAATKNESAKRVQGHLSWFDLASIFYLLCGLRETGLLSLHNTELAPEQEQELEQIKPFAWVYLEQGNIRNARLGVRAGREAFYQLFQMPLEGSFLFQQQRQPSEGTDDEFIPDAGGDLIKEAL